MIVIAIMSIMLIQTSYAAEEQILFSCTILKVNERPEIKSKSFKKISGRSEKKSYFLLEGKLVFRNVELSLKQPDWSWSGTKEPLDILDIDVLATPMLLILSGESASVSVTDETPIEYFEKLPDGNYALKKSRQQVGVLMTVLPTILRNGSIKLDVFEINITGVGERMPLKGVTLDVGAPLISTHSISAEAQINADRDYVILSEIGEESSLLYRIRASVITDYKSAMTNKIIEEHNKHSMPGTNVNNK